MQLKWVYFTGLLTLCLPSLAAAEQCTDYKPDKDWIFTPTTELQSYESMYAARNTVLTNNEVDSKRPFYRALYVEQCIYQGYQGIAIWGFYDQQDRQNTTSKLEKAGFRVAFIDGKLIPGVTLPPITGSDPSPTYKPVPGRALPGRRETVYPTGGTIRERSRCPAGYRC